MKKKKKKVRLKVIHLSRDLFAAKNKNTTTKKTFFSLSVDVNLKQLVGAATKQPTTSAPMRQFVKLR